MVNYTVKTIKGKKYVYSQETIDGKQKETYMGSYDKPEIQALLSPKITPKITEPKENLITYKRQTLAKVKEINRVGLQIDEIFMKLDAWEKELEEETA